jgi:hypothetical protein
LEFHDQGLTTFIKTWNGVVRDVLYVRNGDAALRLISSVASDNDPIELSVANDEEWAQYRALRQTVSE